MAVAVCVGAKRIGAGKATVRGARAANVKFKLSAAGRRRLAHSRRLRIRLRVTVKRADREATRTLRVTLKR